MTDDEHQIALFRSVAAPAICVGLSFVTRIEAFGERGSTRNKRHDLIGQRLPLVEQTHNNRLARTAGEHRVALQHQFKRMTERRRERPLRLGGVVSRLGSEKVGLASLEPHRTMADAFSEVGHAVEPRGRRHEPARPVALLRRVAEIDHVGHEVGRAAIRADHVDLHALE